MAEEFDLKKINVRSPYYVNVVNRSDETQDDIDPTPTEPLVNNFTHECGDTVSVGITSERNVYKISLANRGTGDFEINFTGIFVPFKYRFGMEGSLPAFQTSDGVDLYEPLWLSETGETVSLSPYSLNGVSQTITYNVTQSDLDSGNKLVLEIFHPVISAGYQFTSVCQDPQAANDVDQLAVPSVIIVTVVRRSTGRGSSSAVAFGNRALGVATKRLIFSDASLAITPTHQNDSLFKASGLPTQKWNEITNEYVGTPQYTNVLGSLTTNGALLNLSGFKASNTRAWDIDYIVSRHPVYQDDQNNWKFRTWRDFQLPTQAIKVNVKTRGYCNPSHLTDYSAFIDVEVGESAPITRAVFRNQSTVRCHAAGVTYNTVQLGGNSLPIIQDA